MSDEPSTREVTATCHAEGCGNNGEPIAITVPDVTDPNVACGVCGQTITDLGEVAP